jgi:hypothetical protein
MPVQAWTPEQDQRLLEMKAPDPGCDDKPANDVEKKRDWKQVR